MRARIVACLLSTCAIFWACPAVAQEIAPGEIVVTVTDAVTKVPIDNAEVFLLGGDTPTSTLTDEKGQVIWPDLAAGIYEISVRHDGYAGFDVENVDVEEGQRVKVTVALTKTLKTIAIVTSHPASASISTESIDDESATRKVSIDLKNALNLLAGVSVDDTTYGPTSAFNISLHNNDSSQTGTSINGISTGGSASALLGGAQGLFSGASVSFAPTAGYAAGTVNFETARPTKLWTYNILNSVGNFGAQTESIIATGSKGKLSMAFQHAYTSRDSYLSGYTYADESGLDFQHNSANRGIAEIATATYRVSPRLSVSATGLYTSQLFSTICSTFTTLTPCGFGPAPASPSRNDYGYIVLTDLIGNVSLNVSSVKSGLTYGYSDPGRSLGGTVNPYSSNNRYDSTFSGGRASITAKRHTVALSYQRGATTGQSTVTYDGVPSTLGQPLQSTSNFMLSDRVKANERLALTHSFSYASATGAGTAFVISDAADWKPATYDTFEGSLAIGSAQPSYAGVEPVGDPLTAQYDCYNGSTFVSGPADPAVPQSLTSYSFSWLHQFHGGSLNLSLYRQNAFGQQFNAAVPIDADPSTIFPGGTAAYLGALQNVWDTPTVCGAIPFSPNRVYINQSITGLGEVTAGGSISGRIPLGRNVMVLPNYNVGRAYLSSIDPRLEMPNSFYAVGTQVPHKPLVTAGALIDGVLTHSRLEWVANAQYTSINNGYNLPAFTIFTAGLVFKSDHGTFSLVETNMFGADTGLFTTYQGVNPLAVVGGGSFAYATNPAPPRQWLFTWRLPWNQHVSPPPKKSKPATTAAPKP